MQHLLVHINKNVKRDKTKLLREQSDLDPYCLQYRLPAKNLTVRTYSKQLRMTDDKSC